MDKRADLRKHFANEANQAKSDAMHSERSAQLSSIEETVANGFNSVLNQGSRVGKVEIANDKPIKVEMEDNGTDKLAEAIAGLAQLKGKDGQDGYTPKKGVDYYTEKEINDITDEIFSKVRIPTDGVDGIDGIDGKTPVKGVDYYTDAEIKSIISYILSVIPRPKDGIDGKDGKAPVIDYKKIITEVIKKIPKPKDGKDGKNSTGGGYYGIMELIAGAGISIDATDQYRPIITSTVDTTGKVDKAGDTMTGDLIIGTESAGANLTINGTLGTEAFTNFTVAGNWTLTSGWESTNDGGTQLNHNAAGTTSATFLANAPTIGVLYKVTFTMNASVAGGVTMNYGGASGLFLNPSTGTPVTYTEY
jgi:hypothetical protein